MAKITSDADRCKGCGLCVTACPKSLLAMDQNRINAQGHHPAGIKTPEECIGCASCATICPDCVIRIVVSR